MATYQVIDSYPPFEYGSAVRWIAADGTPVVGSICGFSACETAEKAERVGREVGTIVALVEDSSGKVVEVPLSELKLI